MVLEEWICVCVKGSLSAMRRDGGDKEQLQEKDGGWGPGRGVGRVGGQEVDGEIKRHGSQDALQAWAAGRWRHLLWGDEGQLNAPLKVTRAFPATVTEPLAEQASWWWEL